MTALAPGTTHYVKDLAQKGGVWSGTDAIILNADCSATKAATLKSAGPETIVGRPDMPEKNRFVPASDWIPSSTILYPAQ